jgi:hypothetical protein
MSYAANYKTVMCTYWETGCGRASTCIFAHSAEELRPRMCPYGNRCNFDRRNPRFDCSRRPCGFFHPGEKITQEELFRRATEFTTAKPPPTERVIKTRLCPDYSGCTKSDCPLAHSKEELSPSVCKHGSKCFFNPKNPRYDPSRRPCVMHHPGDTVNQDELFERELLRLNKQVKIQERLAEKIPQFVVRMEEPEEEEEPAVKYSIASVSNWGDDEADPDYDAPLFSQK